MASKARENYFAHYKTSMKWKSNREARLMRAILRNPGNQEQIEAAMSGMVYRRKTPVTQQWTSTMRKQAALFKEFCGSAPIACWSSNPKVRDAAISTLGRDWSQHKLPEGKVDFSLAARAMYPAGPQK